MLFFFFNHVSKVNSEILHGRTKHSKDSQMQRTSGGVPETTGVGGWAERATDSEAPLVSYETGTGTCGTAQGAQSMALSQPRGARWVRDSSGDRAVEDPNVQSVRHTRN